jgi:signal transduction histidine kinase/ActR/RegA family two-component response regulator
MDAPVPLEAVITTAELNLRPSRPVDHAPVNGALVTLMQEMVNSPGTILQRLADTALGLCQAHSAGISLLEDEDGRKIFRWHALAGRYAPYLWGTTPREFSPCGTVLDRDTPQLMSYLERHYTYFEQVSPQIVEALLIPFHVGGQAVGTVWVISHDANRRFDAEDLRVMNMLGQFAASTYQVLSSIKAVEASNAELAKAHADLLFSNEKLKDQIADRTRVGRGLELLWEASRILLTSDDADAIIPSLLDKVGQHLELESFNYIVDESDKTLRLEAFSGISETFVREVRRLEFGQSVCGTVALTRQAIVANHIQQSDDPKVQLIKGFGIRAYACNPLLTKNRLIGTLSFGSRTRDEFTPEELGFLETISHYVTVAYERLRFIRELREADRHKDEFLATLAHELRNPLAPIQNALEVMKMAGDGHEVIRQGREIIERQLAQIMRLDDDILDLSRIRQGKIELRKERIDVASVVAGAVENSRPLIEMAGHKLNVEVPPEPLCLEGDLTRLAQALSNLLHNACKYTPPGGQIDLSVQFTEKDLTLRVRDTGIGISPEMLPLVFDMFAQLDHSRDRSQGGLGIGLSLVRRLVEMHGGTVWAHSAGLGLGSEFVICLPILMEESRLEAISRPASAKEITARCSGRRILVVDDNRDSTESMRLFLGMLGNEVAVAYNGLEAVESVASFRPDVVLLDIGLPILNGYEAARKIRQQAWGKDVVLVALTGWGQEEDRRSGIEAGFDHHLLKPVHPQLIQEFLSTLTSNQTFGA